MWPSLKPSQRVAVAAAIDPQSTEATVSTPWVAAAQFNNFMAVIQVGTMGAGGTVNAQINQATSSAGAGSKAVAVAEITALTQAAAQGSTQSLINLQDDQLDVNDGFAFVSLSITVAGAACLVAGLLLGLDQADGFASDNGAATVNQIVN